MHVGLVPAFDRRDTFHSRMARVDDRVFEGAVAMTLKLGPDEFDVLWRVQKAIRRAMQGHETASPRDEIQQCGLLLRRDTGVVGKYDETIKSGEPGWV